MHAALRQVLGPEALQSGSYNRPGYLRLDYSWSSALSPETRSEVQEVANLAVRADLPVSAHFMTLPEAEQFGALALFGETYDERVRVIEVGGPWSRELCGGTHVKRSSQIGTISLTSDASVGAGLRRVEAEVGVDAIASLSRDRESLRRLGELLKTPNEQLETRVIQMQEELKSALRLAGDAESRLLQAEFRELEKSAEKLGDCTLVAKIIGPVGSLDSLRAATIRLRDSLGPQSIAAFGCVANEKPILLIAVGAALANSSRDARQLAAKLGPLMGGGGGGKPDLAQAGASSVQALELGLAELRKLI
jgi:alanyl-tRNA synthetase